jgi:hypothetical protein
MSAAVGKPRRGFFDGPSGIKTSSLVWRFALGFTEEPAARLPYLVLARDQSGSLCLTLKNTVAAARTYSHQDFSSSPLRIVDAAPTASSAPTTMAPVRTGCITALV